MCLILKVKQGHRIICIVCDHRFEPMDVNEDVYLKALILHRQNCIGKHLFLGQTHVCLKCLHKYSLKG